MCAIEGKENASTFDLKVEKCNYFRILYKNKSDEKWYHLCAPAKGSSGSQLKLSLREDASAQSYVAFYNAKDKPSHSTRLHQRELGKLIEGKGEHKLHITCQFSVDSYSRDVSDLYVKKIHVDEQHKPCQCSDSKDASVKVKVRHGKTKHGEEKEHDTNSTHFTEFVLLSKDSLTEGSKDSTQSQGSDNTQKDSKQPESSPGNKGSFSEDSKQPQTSSSKDSVSIESSQQTECIDSTSTTDSNRLQCSNLMGSETSSKNKMQQS